MKTTVKLVSALGIAAAAGFIAGILLAPDKGAETRKKLAGSMRDGVQSGKDKFKSLKSEVLNGLKHIEDIV